MTMHHSWTDPASSDALHATGRQGDKELRDLVQDLINEYQDTAQANGFGQDYEDDWTEFLFSILQRDAEFG